MLFLFFLIDPACGWLRSFFSFNLSVSVCFPLTPYCVDDQAHHPLDRLLTANTLHPSNGTSFAHLLIIDLMPSLFTRGTCAATAVTASITKNYAVQDSCREVRKHSRFPVTHGSGLRAPNSHLLCSVMLLDKRFARPRADLHHRPNSNWSASCLMVSGHITTNFALH